MGIQRRFIPSSSFNASGDAFLNALFSDGPQNKPFTVAATVHMHQALDRDLPVLDVDVKPDFPMKWEYAAVNTKRYLRVPRDETYLLIKALDVGRVANFSSGKQAVIEDIRPVLVAIQKRLITKSPVRPSNMRAWHPRGLYKASHEIWINGKRWNFGPVLDETPYGYVLNRLDYASTLETPDFSVKTHRAYQRVFAWARQKYGKDWDITLMFADPKEVGGNILSSRYRKANPVYAIPVIIVFPLNTMPLGYSNAFRFKKRRSKKQRTNVLNAPALRFVRR
jgi:hypothetical protein